MSLIDYRRESIDPALSLMNITRNLVKQEESQTFQSCYTNMLNLYPFMEIILFTGEA